MDEKEFIYKSIRHLTDQVSILTETVENQNELIDGLIGVIEMMQSPEYARKQANVADMVDIADKIRFMHSLKREGHKKQDRK